VAEEEREPSRGYGILSPHENRKNVSLDAELQAVIGRWPNLPFVVQASILVTVSA